MRDADHPFTLAIIAWALMSALTGISTAQRWGWWGVWLIRAFVLAALAVAAAFALMSVGAAGMIIWFRWFHERQIRRRR
jgi:hypothetical protein